MVCGEFEKVGDFIGASDLRIGILQIFTVKCCTGGFLLVLVILFSVHFTHNTVSKTCY